MARTFTSRESELIRDSLISRGKELFAAQGIRKTTVDDLVAAAGIAKGSFYKFFPSKEDLYLEILEKEEADLRLSIDEDLIRGDTLTVDNIKKFFMTFIQFMNTSPLILNLFQEQALDHLMRRLDPVRLQKHMENDEVWAREIFKDWQSAGYLKTMDPEVFASVMRTVFILFTQKEAIGSDTFDRTMDFIIDGLSREIIRSRDLRT